jgi:hypothetical protein
MTHHENSRYWKQWERVLSPFPVSPREYFFLSNFWDASLHRERAILGAFEESPELGTCEDYIATFSGCMEKKWIHWVMPDEERQQRVQRANEHFPQCAGEVFSRSGRIDLTSKGYRLLKKLSVHQGTFRDVGIRPRYRRRDFARYEIYAKSKKAIDAFLEWKAHVEYLVTIVKISKATRWRLSRFEVVRGGYCYLVQEIYAS